MGIPRVHTGSSAGGEHFEVGEASGRAIGRRRRDRDRAGAGVRQDHAQRDGRGDRGPGGRAAWRRRRRDRGEHGVGPGALGRDRRRGASVARSGPCLGGGEDHVRWHVWLGGPTGGPAGRVGSGPCVGPGPDERRRRRPTRTDNGHGGRGQRRGYAPVPVLWCQSRAGT